MNLCYLAKFGKNKFNLWHMLLGAIAGGAHTVAEICVECLNFPAAADTTFECYYADTAKPLNDVGLSNILKRKTSEDEAAASATGLERQGKTWEEIFRGLKSAEELG